MRKTLRKGRSDFGKRLIQYAIEGGVLEKCKNHSGSVYQAQQDRAPAHAAAKDAWQKGYISSDLKPAIEQMDKLIDKAPNSCSHVECWR
ncbi:MAG: hypothetical protein ABJN69_12920 [Hellea sp.]